MYQALYRKYRPRTFDEVVGQEHITETLKTQVRTGRLGHAYLFIGTRGTGKTTCARILARAVNCEHPVDGNPCGECAACRGLESGSILDVTELDAASNNGVDHVRALRDEAVFAPASVKKRVYIIDEVHMLSGAAFNALLKILEEPPEHLMFILATTELRKIPVTILSRCQRYSFRCLSPECIGCQLMHVAGQEGLELTEPACELLSRLADGSMRDGLSLLDQCAGTARIDVQDVLSTMGLAGKQQTAKLLAGIAAHDIQQVLTVFRSLWSAGGDPVSILGELAALLRDALLLQVAPGGGQLLTGGFDRQTLEQAGRDMTAAELLAALRHVQGVLDGMGQSVNPRLTAELCLVALCRPELSEDLAQLRARVSRLEAGLSGGAVQQPARPEPAGRAELSPKEAAACSLRNDAPPAGENEQNKEESPPPDGSLPPKDDLFAPPKESTPPRDEAPAPMEEPVRPAETPAAPSAPVQPAASEPESGDRAALWRTLVGRMKTRLPIGHYTLLENGVQITGTFTDGGLTLSADPGFAYDLFKAPQVLDEFRAVASELCGRTVPVKLEAAAAAAPDQASRNLEQLMHRKGITIKS